MSDFIKNSIFTDYALKRISNSMLGVSGHMFTDNLTYKIGSNVALNRLNPAKTDFSGLEYTLNRENDSNITVTKDDNTYTVKIIVDSNLGIVTFNDIGIFDSNGTLVGLIELSSNISVPQLIYDGEYVLYLIFDINTLEIIAYKQEVIVANIIGSTNILYTFISVRLGDGSNDLDTSKTDVSKLIYSLPIESITKSGYVVTISALIPEELEDVTITEIGLFENFNGKDNMFSYTKVSTVKPSDLGFKLAIELNLELEVVNFYPELPVIVINEYDYANQEALDNLKKTFLYLESNLERVIQDNATLTGYNIPQVYYAKQKEIRDCLSSAAYSSRYNRLLTKFGDNLKDLFFLTRQDYSSYKVKNLAMDESYITVSEDKILSNKDNITFNDGPISICATVLFGNISQNGVILTKDDDAGSIYFTWSMEYVANATSPSDSTRLLRFQLMSTPNSIGFTYNLNESTYKAFMQSNYLVYTICFNGSFSNPLFKFYINGEEQDITAVGTGTVVLQDLSSCKLKNYRSASTSEALLENVTITRLSTYNKYLSDLEVYYALINTENPTVSED